MTRKTDIRWTDFLRAPIALRWLLLIALAPLLALGWPPDFARRWPALIPLGVVAVTVAVAYVLARRTERRSRRAPD